MRFPLPSPGTNPIAEKGEPLPFDVPDPVEAYRMPLMDHLRELRRRLTISLASGGAGMVLCLSFADRIWRFLVAPMNDALAATGRGTMAITAPLEGFTTYMKIGAFAGVLLASPVIFWQLWVFVAPGLYPREKKLVLPMVVSSTVLFLAGAAFGYFVIFRYAFPFFLDVTADGVEAVLSMQSYLSLAVNLLLAFGACFELPVVAFFLGRIGLIDHKDLIRFFRYSVVAIFVVAAFLTPPDVLSQLLMAGPLLVLYGLSIVVVRFTSTKVREAEGA